VVVSFHGHTKRIDGSVARMSLVDSTELNRCVVMTQDREWPCCRVVGLYQKCRSPLRCGIGIWQGDQPSSDEMDGYNLASASQPFRSSPASGTIIFIQQTYPQFEYIFLSRFTLHNFPTDFPFWNTQFFENLFQQLIPTQPLDFIFRL
jgi:hypothetical protein